MCDWLLFRGILVHFGDAQALMDEQLHHQQVGAPSVQGSAQLQAQGAISATAGEQPLPKLVNR